MVQPGLRKCLTLVTLGPIGPVVVTRRYQLRMTGCLHIHRNITNLDGGSIIADAAAAGGGTTHDAPSHCRIVTNGRVLVGQNTLEYVDPADSLHVALHRVLALLDRPRPKRKLLLMLLVYWLPNSELFATTVDGRLGSKVYR
uniref:Putative secreted peptide n=1 Tax=Anopheles braziliensis TaxID=58242 RepID=A0A2M3ZT41_9DIPT